VHDLFPLFFVLMCLDWTPVKSGQGSAHIGKELVDPSYHWRYMELPLLIVFLKLFYIKRTFDTNITDTLVGLDYMGLN